MITEFSAIPSSMGVRCTFVFGLILFIAILSCTNALRKNVTSQRAPKQ